VSPAARDHPLVGRIWEPGAGRFADSAALLDALAGGTYLLLGEKHDNADHQRLQAWLLTAVTRRGRAPAVAFEMLGEDQAAPLAAHLAAHPGDAAGIGAAAALAAGGPLLAANLSRPNMRAIAREGIDSLGAGRVAALGLDRPLAPDLVAVLRRDIVESHCRQLPEAMIGPMAATQTAKDAQMADVLRRGAAAAGPGNGAVLIAGGGHARIDLGVPWYLRRAAPDARVVSVGLLEVVAGESDPAAYARTFGVEHLPFDFVWFTPRADELDPCAEFADQLRRAKERFLRNQPVD